MSKLVCLFWVPGSCGDLVRQLLINTGQYSNQSKTVVNEVGRVLPSVDPYLIEQFPTPADVSWHNRTWYPEDIVKLKQISNKSTLPFIIGTHRLDQLDLIKDSIDDCLTIGVTFNNDLYPAVIKNWCKKASESSLETNLIYKKSHPILSEKFKEKGLYSEFMLLEILKHINNIPKQITPRFDINVNLGEILNSDLSSLAGFLTQDSVAIFDQWYLLQDPLYKYKFECNDDYINALGYNHCATTVCHHDINLSRLDHILISQYCKTKNLVSPTRPLETHTEATLFFNNQQLS